MRALHPAFLARPQDARAPRSRRLFRGHRHLPLLPRQRPHACGRDRCQCLDRHHRCRCRRHYGRHDRGRGRGQARTRGLDFVATVHRPCHHRAFAGPQLWTRASACRPRPPALRRRRQAGALPRGQRRRQRQRRRRERSAQTWRRRRSCPTAPPPPRAAGWGGYPHAPCVSAHALWRARPHEPNTPRAPQPRRSARRGALGGAARRTRACTLISSPSTSRAPRCHLCLPEPLLAASVCRTAHAGHDEGGRWMGAAAAAAWRGRTARQGPRLPGAAPRRAARGSGRAGDTGGQCVAGRRRRARVPSGRRGGVAAVASASAPCARRPCADMAARAPRCPLRSRPTRAAGRLFAAPRCPQRAAAGRGGCAARATRACARRPRLGQDARAHQPRGAPARDGARAALAHPGHHIHAPCGRRAAAARSGARWARPRGRDARRDVSLRVRASAALGRRRAARLHAHAVILHPRRGGRGRRDARCARAPRQGGAPRKGRVRRRRHARAAELRQERHEVLRRREPQAAARSARARRLPAKVVKDALRARRARQPCGPRCTHPA